MVIQGWTTDSVYNLLITGEPYQFTGVYNNENYTMAPVQASSILTIKSSNVHINGLQFVYNTSLDVNIHQNRGLIFIDTPAGTTLENIQISNNLFNCNNLRHLNGVVYNASGVQAFVYNNLFTGLGSGNSYDIFVNNPYASGAAINNTFFGGIKREAASIASNSERFYLYNNFLFQQITAFGLSISGVFNINSNGNITSDLLHNVFPYIQVSGFMPNAIISDIFKGTDTLTCQTLHNNYLSNSGVVVDNIWGLNQNYFDKSVSRKQIPRRTHVGAYKTSSVVKKINNNSSINHGTVITGIGPSGSKLVQERLSNSYIDVQSIKLSNRFERI